VIPMLFWGTIILAFGIFLQGSGMPTFEGDIFTDTESKKLEKERDVNDRIKIYTNASKRIQKRLNRAASKGEFSSVPNDLKLWIELLAKSLEDIETNLMPGKKSKNLIKYEIQVRKSLADMEDYRIGAPFEQQDAFESSIRQAGDIRQRFVALIFP
jgi:hypothetical protein